MVENMPNNNTLVLRSYVPKDLPMIEDFQLSDKDLKFVRTPKENITAALSDDER